MQKKVYHFISSLGAELATKENLNAPCDKGWNEPLVDISDFTPLAELVRSFQPQDSSVNIPQFDFPDGVDTEPDNFEPPHLYSDPVDTFEAVKEVKSKLATKLKAQNDVNVINVDSPADKTAKVVNRALAEASGASEASGGANASGE